MAQLNSCAIAYLHSMGESVICGMLLEPLVPLFQNNCRSMAYFLSEPHILIIIIDFFTIDSCLEGNGGARLHVSDLRSMDIINISDGSRLGPVLDLDLDLEHGRVKGLVVSMFTSKPSFFGSGNSGRGGDLFISWEKVVKIGIDVILVDVASRYDHRYNDRYG